tara:strand:+ start:152 stop:538 length:387 start_codon:yes stop_codon:yes gene_type:complete
MTNYTSDREMIKILLPYLSGNEGGKVDTYTTIDGFTGYKFPCPFCGKFYDNPKTRNKQMALLFPKRKKGQLSDEFFFLCKRKGGFECKSGIVPFYNFFAMYMGTKNQKITITKVIKKGSEDKVFERNN